MAFLVTFLQRIGASLVLVTSSYLYYGILGSLVGSYFMVHLGMCVSLLDFIVSSIF